MRFFFLSKIHTIFRSIFDFWGFPILSFLGEGGDEHVCCVWVADEARAMGRGALWPWRHANSGTLLRLHF
jgi:hypothetical protein